MAATPLLQIHFESLKEGRLIKELVATFEVRPAEGGLLALPRSSSVRLATPPAVACLRTCLTACPGSEEGLPVGAGSCPHPQPEWGFLANPWFSRLRMNFAESHGFAGHLESQPQTIVTLNATISAAQLPPPPFKGVVKGAPCPLQLATCHHVSSSG